MPFFREISIEGCRGGIWKITETWEELCRMLPRAAEHHAHARQRFSSEKRRLEYAAVRVLLFSLTGEDREVCYHPSGRPYFEGSPYALSVSHTNGYAAVLLSREDRPGVDIEACSFRVMRLKDRIVGPEETADTMYEILLHWSAKETAFKLLDEEGIDFTHHFRVEGLSCSSETEGQFRLSYHLKDGKQGVFTVSFLTTQDFVLTYAIYSNLRISV